MTLVVAAAPPPAPIKPLEGRAFAFVGTVPVEPGARALTVGVSTRGAWVRDASGAWACVPWHRIAAFAALDPAAAEGPGDDARDINAAEARALARRAAADGQGTLPGIAPSSEPPPAADPVAPKRRQRCKACGELSAAKRNTVCAGCEAKGVTPRDVGAKAPTLSAVLSGSS